MVHFFNRWELGHHVDKPPKSLELLKSDKTRSSEYFNEVQPATNPER